MADSILNSANFLSESNIDLSKYADLYTYSGHRTFSITAGYYTETGMLIDGSADVKIPTDKYSTSNQLILAFSITNLKPVYTATNSTWKSPYYWRISFRCKDYNGTFVDYSSLVSTTGYIIQAGILSGSTGNIVFPVDSFRNNPDTISSFWANVTQFQLWVGFQTSSSNDPNPSYYTVNAEYDIELIALII